MKLVILGAGKTGSQAAEVARERGHDVTVLTSADNQEAAGLSAERLAGVDCVIDFTRPEAVMQNISACTRAGVNMVVGTTGWHRELDYVKQLVAASNSGFLFGSNFSIGVNVYLEIVRAAAAGLALGYTGRIVERHHEQKKDAPSGTAVTMQNVVKEASGIEPEITSIREGEVIGTHVMLLDATHDTMMLVHDAKSRRGFAEGAVRAAEWLHGKKGFYEFKDIFRELT